MHLGRGLSLLVIGQIVRFCKNIWCGDSPFCLVFPILSLSYAQVVELGANKEREVGALALLELLMTGSWLK